MTEFNRYFTNNELRSFLKRAKDKHPYLVELLPIGKSYEGRSLTLAVVTNKKSGTHLKKPAIWVDANLHAIELAGTTAALHLIETLTTRYAKDRKARELLDTCAFYILPRIDMDGAALAMAKKPRFIRSGTRPYPWEDKMDGLHEEDMDGNGKILQMRIPDPNGDWKVSSLHPWLMEKRGIDESGGKYYRILSEGRIENFDGSTIKFARPVQSLDFNRNFPFEWRPESEQYGAGPYPTSELEIRAVVDFISRHKNISVALSYHTYSGVLLRPYGTKSDEALNTQDLWLYQALGRRAKEVSGYPCISVFHDLRYHPKEVITGTFNDWFYEHYGVLAFTVEIWDLIGAAGIKERKYIDWFREHPHKEDLKIFRWIRKNGPKDGYVKWYKFKHPQLGMVELGGWNHMYTLRNPPHKFMGREAKKNTDLVITFAKTLPQLELYKCEVNELSKDTFKIELVIDNKGFLSTATTQKGRERNVVRTVRAKLALPRSVKLRQGKMTVELGHLEGRSNKFNSSFYGASPTDNRARAEWVVAGRKGDKITVEVVSDRAGTIRKVVALGS